MNLCVSNTERLRFRSEEAEYGHLFEGIHSLDQISRSLEDIMDLPEKERLSALEERTRKIEEEIDFIVAHVAPKEVEPNIRAVVYAETFEGEPVGRVVINQLKAEHPSIDVRVLPEKRHMGYGTEMLRAIIFAAFDQGVADHLEYDVLTSNTPSMRLVRKLGGQQVYSDEIGEMYVFYPTDVDAAGQAV